MSDVKKHGISQKSNRVVLAIFGICALVELVLSAADLGIVGTLRWRGLAYQYGGFWQGLLGDWRANFAAQPYVMFLSYGFLHGGIIHFAVNMFTLISIGKPVIQRIGQVRFLVLYIGSMLGGGAGFALLSQSVQPMIGESGALFGLAGAIVAWEVRRRVRSKRPMWPVLKVILLLLALNLILWWVMRGQLAWETHLGGFVSGWILALLIDPRSRQFVRQRPKNKA